MTASQQRCADIQAHLRAGGKVMVATYARGTIYDKRHIDMFSATEKDLFVRRGKGKDCLNFTPVKFSR